MTGGINDTKIIKQTIGERLKKARKAAGYTQQELSDALAKNHHRPILKGRIDSVSINRYKKWEDGTNSIELEWIPAICDVLSCDIGYLFGEYAEKKRAVADVCTQTGLTEKAAEKLCEIRVDCGSVLSAIITDENFEYLMEAFKKRFQYSEIDGVVKPIVQEGEDGKCRFINAPEYHEYFNKTHIQIPVDGSRFFAKKKNLLDSIISTAITDRMFEMAKEYREIVERIGQSGTKE